MINNKDIIETINMVQKENFDVRTITMGISLMDCIASTADKTATNCYDLICKRAENIVKVAKDLSTEYGVPIINKRVSVTPVSLITAGFKGEELKIAKALDIL